MTSCVGRTAAARGSPDLRGLWVAPPLLVLALLFFYPIVLIARQSFVCDARR